MDRILVYGALLTGTMHAKLSDPLAIPTFAAAIAAGLFGLRWWSALMIWVIVVTVNFWAIDGARSGQAALSRTALAWLVWVLIAWGVSRLFRAIFKRAGSGKGTGA